MDANERPACGSVTRRRGAAVVSPAGNTLWQVRGTPCLRHARWAAAHTAGSVGRGAPRPTLPTSCRRGRICHERGLWPGAPLVVSAISPSKWDWPLERHSLTVVKSSAK